jgi:hypothetical protein
LDVSAISLKSESPTIDEDLSGVVAGGSVALTWSRLSVDLLYLQGSADPEGDHARSYITGVGTQRWLFWELRLAAQTRLGSPVLLAYFEGWNGVSSKLDVAESLDRAQGLEGGLRLEPQGTPFWARVGYRVDHSRLGGGVRRETAEYITVGLGVALGAR